jgi:O-antigen ligase
VVWVYAAKRFIQSPVFGIGFGRYNDFNLNLEGIKGVAYFALGGNQVINESTAHNTYLHVLAESGIVGLFLLMWFWRSIFLRLRRAENKYPSGSVMYSYFRVCQGVVLFVLAASMFGHWCAGPAVGIPAMTLIGAGLSYDRRSVSRKTKESLEENEQKVLLHPAG